MRRGLHCIGGATLALSLLSAAPASLAQTGRQWVDPPTEGTAPAASQTPSSTPSLPENKPISPQPSVASSASSAPTIEQDNTKQTKTSVETPSTPSQPKSAVKRAPAKKSVAERKEPRAPRQAAAPARNSGQLSSNMARDRVRGRNTSGLEVMTLRTIEYPDGRRVQFLTRPQPGAMSELLE